MNLQNGYKVIYEKAADGKRTFYASKTGLFADAEVITEATIGEYKLIYEKDGQFYGSTTGIPAEGDHCFDAFDKVFKTEEPAAAQTASIDDEDEITPEPENAPGDDDELENEPEGDPEDDPEDEE
jgi:hypothetical protein